MVSRVAFLCVVFAVVMFAGCDRLAKFTSGKSKPAANPPPVAEGRDAPQQEIDAFERSTRQLFNNRQFAALEKLANDLRTTKALFGNGSWKLSQFYGALECRKEEPESMWQLHSKIYGEWKTAFPQSITARVAHALYFKSYAWKARGSGFANTVTEEGWRLFRQRLALAQQVLISAKALPQKCPAWYGASLVVAAALEEERARFDMIYREGKQLEPTYWKLDATYTYFLLPRWMGRPGDWEKAAAAEVNRPGGLGAEGYAEVVVNLLGYYDNIFSETQASWRLTKEGCEILRQKYPASREILNVYCVLACQAEDRGEARALFKELGNRYKPSVWRKEERFVKARDWAMKD